MRKHLDPGSQVIAGITLVLFVAALFVKGLTHDLFLEAGIFLISLKIILMTYRNSVVAARQEEKLDLLLKASAGNCGQSEN